MTGIVTQVDGPVLRIVLDRPDKLNAVNTSMLRALKAAIDTAKDDSVRCVVLTGAGRAFCAGGDLTGVDTDGAAVAATSSLTRSRSCPSLWWPVFGAPRRVLDARWR